MFGSRFRYLSLWLVAVCAAASMLLWNGNVSKAQTQSGPDIPIISPGSAYRQTNLVSDVPGLSPVLDPLLVNPWGLTATSSSPFWVANNGTSTSQLIRGDVAGAPVVLNAGMPTV